MTTTAPTFRQRLRAYLREIAWSILTFYDTLMPPPIDGSRLPDTLDGPVKPKHPRP